MIVWLGWANNNFLVGCSYETLLWVAIETYGAPHTPFKVILIKRYYRITNIGEGTTHSYNLIYESGIVIL